MEKTRRILLLCALVTLIPSLAAQQQETPSVELLPMTENLYQVNGGRGSQGGAYVGETGVLLIDAKMDQDSYNQVIAALKEVTDRPILYLVNTHSDGDHITGNRFFPETVTIIAHENCRKEFFRPRRDGSASEWTSPELAPFLPSVTFNDQLDLYLGPKKVELRYFGVGHTTGDIIVHFPEERVAFLGDQLFLSRPQLIHEYKGGSALGHVNVLTRMLDSIEAEKFLSGHSIPVDREMVREHIDKMKQLQQKVDSLVRKGYSLEQVQAEFSEAEARLVGVVFNETK